MYAIGIRLGAMDFSVGVIQNNGVILAQKTAPTLRYRQEDEIFNNIWALCEAVAEEAGLEIEKDISHIGLGCSGVPNMELGTLVYSSSFDTFNMPIRKAMGKHTSRPVYIENDANCYAFAEGRFGASKGHGESVTVLLDSSIGAGIVLDGKIYHGAYCGAGEVGHQVIVADGEGCKCGRNGCWEAYASADALIRDASIMAIRNQESLLFAKVNGDIRAMNAEIAFSAAEEGDIWAARLIHKYLRYVAVGLINIINIMQPEVIVLGGKISQMDNASFLQPVKNMVYSKIYGDRTSQMKPELCKAKFGPEAVIIGAGLLEQ